MLMQFAFFAQFALFAHQEQDQGKCVA